MDKEQFWQIIDEARNIAGRWQDMYTPLVHALSHLTESDIIGWKQIFDEYQSLSYKEKLWAAAATMLGGCSNDSFDYFRGWLTAQGKKVFLDALADPDSLANVGAVQLFAQEVWHSEGLTPLKGYCESARFEEILYAADYAYEIRTSGNDLYEHLGTIPLSHSEKRAILDEITYATDIDARWGDDDDWLIVNEQLQRMLPKLHQTFNTEEPPMQQPDKAPTLIKTKKIKKKRTKSGPEI